METVKEKKRYDAEAMMKAYRELAVPGKAHRILSRLAGTWTSKGKFWMDPAKPPIEGTGQTENVLILDGRFLQMKETSQSPGGLFTNIATLGYDNHTKKYQTVAMSTMATGMYLYEGKAGPDENIVSQESSYDEPAIGPMRYRAVTHIIDDDTYTFEMTAITPAGEEMNMMETRYTRKK